MDKFVKNPFKNGLLLIALVTSLTLVSCAAMKAEYIAENCNPSAAYAGGVNDAKNGNDMKPNYASVFDCDEDQTALNQSYADGFKFGLNATAGDSGGRRADYQCKSSFGNKVCGYHCVQSMNTVQCASTPDQTCLATDFGEIACGYGCAKSQNTVKCAQRRRENCAADNFGNVKCGRNCRAEPSGVTCDGTD